MRLAHAGPGGGAPGDACTARRASMQAVHFAGQEHKRQHAIHVLAKFSSPYACGAAYNLEPSVSSRPPVREVEGQPFNLKFTGLTHNFQLTQQFG